MHIQRAALAAVFITIAATMPAAAQEGPTVDAHQHIVSPERAKANSDVPRPRIELPADLDAFLKKRIAAERDRVELAKLYAPKAWFLESFNPGFIVGADSIVDFWVGATESPYDLVPIGYGLNGNAAHIASYLVSTNTGKRDAHFVQSLAKGGDGQWRITTEVLTMGGPYLVDTISAHGLVALLDSAKIQRALVLSLAFQNGRPQTEGPDEYEKVKAENDWTAAQVALYPDRLRAFCSFNPLRSYALAEIGRCAKNGFRGVKMQLGNSRVDLNDAEHIAKLRAVFAEANRVGLAIVIHLAPHGQAYGRKQAETVLEQVIAAAPDIPIQIAHLGSPGRLDATSDSALAVLAEAVAAGDKRVRNMWFDVTTIASRESSPDQIARAAARIRQIGVNRVVYGSDTPDATHLKPREGWAAFRMMLPLTDAEFRTIATNVPPYAR